MQEKISPTEEELKQVNFEVMQLIALFEISKNPVYLWESLAAITQPTLSGLPISLHETIRTYIHDASKKIVSGAVGPPEHFSNEALLALGFRAGKKGASTAREYAKLQSTGQILTVYDALKHRYGSSRAEEIMGAAINITPVSLRQRLTAARAFYVKIHAKLGIPKSSVIYPTHYREMPDIFLEQVVKGMPNVFWRGKGQSSRKTFAKR